MASATMRNRTAWIGCNGSTASQVAQAVSHLLACSSYLIASFLYLVTIHISYHREF